MLLRDDILNAVSPDKPGGDDIRYTPLYDQIKEARREEDDAEQGEWKRERKVADYPRVLKLATEAIAKKSKDLQLAAWTTEALLKVHGFAGLFEGISLIHALIEQFWDHLYPELEDGDAEFRATPLDWVGVYLVTPVRMLPMNRAGHNWFQYKESRQIGYEADCAEDEEKLERFRALVAEGKISADDFDKSFEETPKQFYKDNFNHLNSCLEKLDELDSLCAEKFGDFKPTFAPLREALEEVRHTWRQLLNLKLEREPDEAPVPEPEASEAAESGAEAETWAGWQTAAASVDAEAVAPARVSAPRGAVPLEPEDKEDAIRRIIVAADWLRRNDPYSPAPYLVLRGLRWGELRWDGTTLDPLKMEAPPTEIRTELKRQALEGNWEAVLETAEKAAGMPCGRAWLDLHRYVDRACSELGDYYSSIARAVRSGVRELVKDYPGLLEASLLDDTPCANADTRAWIEERCLEESSHASAPPPRVPAEEESSVPPAGEGQPAAPPDAFDLAMEAVERRDVRGAIEILSREIAIQRSGRGRFRRKMQLAQVCLSAGLDDVAAPILDELAREIEERKLEDWESPELVAAPLAMLYRCLDKLERPPEDRARLYAKICRLDPAQAMSLQR